MGAHPLSKADIHLENLGLLYVVKATAEKQNLDDISGKTFLMEV